VSRLAVLWEEARSIAGSIRQQRGNRLQATHGIDNIRAIAKRRLPRLAFDYIDGGADDEITLRANRRVWQEEIVLRPRFLQGVEERNQSKTIFGTSLSTPVLFGPAGLLRIPRWEGNLAAPPPPAREGTVYVLSSNSSVSLEEVAASVPGDKLWFQLYLWRDRARNAELLERAAANGCETLVVTVDVPVAGNRSRDLRNGFTIPLRPNARMAVDLARHPAWIQDYLARGPITFANFTEMGHGRQPTQLFKYINTELAHPGASLEDLRWLRETWSGRLVVKGTMTPEDAEDAVGCGVDGICVSNHGGRQIDGVAATGAVLRSIVEQVDGRAAVFIDGGIRRGTEVLKALALGADAVFIGRPYVYGLGAGGEVGAARVLQIYKQEIDLALALIGCDDIAKVDFERVEYRSAPV
jgi:isopentenyl diphosphate isomerase/L-lactate dehydrogenase-like FMN-dependent dehydrogenase